MAVDYLGADFSQSSVALLNKPSFVRRFVFASFRYYMRARDSTGALVMWIADCVDPTGSQSSSINKPFTDPVILSVKGNAG